MQKKKRRRCDEAYIQSQKQLIYSFGLDDFFMKFGQFLHRNITEGTHVHEHKSNVIDHVLQHAFMDSNISLTQLDGFKSLLSALEDTDLSLPCIDNLDREISSLSKGVIISLRAICNIVKITSFFNALKHREDISNEYFLRYIASFAIPKDMLDIISHFNIDNTSLKSYVHSNLDIASELSYIKLDSNIEILELYNILESKLKDKSIELNNILHLQAMQEYLIDKQIHYTNGNLCLLARSGYSACVQARAIGRSASGYFYIVPIVLEKLQSQIYTLLDKMETKLLDLRKSYSKILSKHISFISYINKQYDIVDNAYARVTFAKHNNLEFIQSGGDSIILQDYAHPSLNTPVLISVRFNRSLLMITGVNAGGKTMLLKSILSAILCANLSIPMRINASKSMLPYISDIGIIAQDPQDSKNDISTFSGRIMQISTYLQKKNFILGIDEIEIGTDTNEVASLYKVILDCFLDNNAIIIVTTHHKQLATLMSGNPKVQLLAALYDYKRMQPAFEFVEGIGKSYAMECAKRYGVPDILIQKAKALYGECANKLERLIEVSNELITKNKQENIKLQELRVEYELQKAELEKEKDRLKKEFNKESLELKRHYNEAIKEIKMLAKQSRAEISLKQNMEYTEANIHRMLNKTKHRKNDFTIKDDKTTTNNLSYNINDWVAYNNKIYRIIELSYNTCVLESSNGVRLKSINIALLRIAKKPRDNTAKYTLLADIRASTTIDLHGMTREEALEALEIFLNQAIMAKFGEVLVIYGLGSGILRRVVREYLDKCKYIRGYTDAPPESGGLGASIVYL